MEFQNFSKPLYLKARTANRTLLRLQAKFNETHAGTITNPRCAPLKLGRPCCCRVHFSASRDGAWPTDRDLPCLATTAIDAGKFFTGELLISRGNSRYQPRLRVGLFKDTVNTSGLASRLLAASSLVQAQSWPAGIRGASQFISPRKVQVWGRTSQGMRHHMRVAHNRKPGTSLSGVRGFLKKRRLCAPSHVRRVCVVAERPRFCSSPSKSCHRSR